MFRLQGHGAVILGCIPKKKGFTGCESVALAAEQPALRTASASRGADRGLERDPDVIADAVGIDRVTGDDAGADNPDERKEHEGKYRVNRGLRSRLHLQD